MRAWLVIAALLAACGGDGETISVFTAASLGPAMEETARAFERAHDGAEVRVVVAGSQVLRRQIEEGAPADVFVPASPEHARAIGELLGAPRTFACNEPVVVVPPSSPVRSFADLAGVDRLVVGTPEVPLGAYTEAILSRAPAKTRRRIEARIVSREPDARQVLAKVVLGEADAAIVYRTDALRAGPVREVPIDRELSVVARYAIATTRASRAPELAGAFVAFTRGDEGRAILASHGFTECEAP